MNISRTWKIISSVATGVVAISTAFIVLGLEFPRPAWASELKALAGHVIELDSTITSQQLDDTRLRLYQNERERRAYITENSAVPQFLISERVLLERQIENLTQHLDTLRND